MPEPSDYIYGDLDANDNPRPVLLAGGEGEGDVAVSITSTNSPVDEGDDLTVDFDATNNTSGTVDATFVLKADGDTVDTKSATFGDTESKNLTLTWETVEGDAGSYTVTVESGTDTDSQPVDILTGDADNYEEFSDETVSGTGQTTADGSITLDADEDFIMQGTVELNPNGNLLTAAVTLGGGGFIADLKASSDDGDPKYELSGVATGSGTSSETGDGTGYTVDLMLRREDGSTRVYADGELVIDTGVSSYNAGTYGLRYSNGGTLNGSQTAEYRDWRVYTPP